MKPTPRTITTLIMSSLFALVMISVLTITVINADTEHLSLTSNPLLTGSPSGTVSPTLYLPVVQKPYPDQQQILFVSDRAESEKYDLYRMDSEGKNVTRLTNLGIASNARFIHGFLPQWSPNGTRFLSQIENELFIFSADGTQMESLTASLYEMVDGIPQWSPDGTKIAYIANTCEEPRPLCGGFTGGGVRVFDLETKDILQVLPNDMFVDPEVNVQWAPDGLSIFAQSDMRVRIGYMDGSPYKTIPLKDDYGYDYSIGEFSLSPKGQKIAFTIKMGDYAGFFAYTANIDGTNIEQIFSDPPPYDRLIFSIVWHPSGEKLAYVLFDYPAYNRTLFVANADGSDPQDVLPANHKYVIRLVGWTSDGSKMLFSSDGEEEFRKLNIFTINGDGSNLTNLTPGFSNDDVASDSFP